MKSLRNRVGKEIYINFSPFNIVMQKYFFICNYLLIIVFGLFNYHKFKESLPLKLFLYFLIYSFFTEVAGAYFAYYLRISSNFISNTWNIANSLFYSLFFLSAIVNLKKRRLIIGLALVYIILILSNILFLKNYFSEFLLNNVLFGSVLIVFVIMVYYAELLNSEAILNIKYSLTFWVSTGVLLSNIILLPVWVFAEYFSYQGLFRGMIFTSNIIMSLCFITGFLVSKREYNIN